MVYFEPTLSTLNRLVLDQVKIRANVTKSDISLPSSSAIHSLPHNLSLGYLFDMPPTLQDTCRLVTERSCNSHPAVWVYKEKKTRRRSKSFHLLHRSAAAAAGGCIAQGLGGGAVGLRQCGW